MALDTDVQAETDALLFQTMLTPEGRQDPYGAYAEMRSRSPRHDSAVHVLVLTEYDDCKSIMGNPKFGREEPDMESPFGGFGETPERRATPGAVDDEEVSSMLFLNPPDHTRIRGLVSRAFTPRRVEGLRPTIESLVDGYIESLASTGGGDIFDHLAIPFPVAVISALLGVPNDLDDTVRALVRDSTALIDVAATPEATEAGIESVTKLGEIFTTLIAEKRTNPGDDLLTGLIQAEADGDKLSERELIANALLLYAAGFETTSNLIGNGLWQLLSHPNQMQILREQRDLLPSALTEILRFDSPVQLNGRVALETTELFDRTFERGESAITLLGAANRDPKRYVDPESFDVARFSRERGDVPPPLSFGWGVHHCLGAHLAQVEGEIVFGRLLDTFSEISLAGPEPRYRDSFTLRGLETLEIALDPA